MITMCGASMAGRKPHQASASLAVEAEHALTGQRVIARNLMKDSARKPWCQTTAIVNGVEVSGILYLDGRGAGKRLLFQPMATARHPA